ncbi:hypothetical protein OH77DRAFT_1398753, partial [Trametes cingulata]
AALLFFEWAITLDREVELVWLNKRTGASLLFVLNGYLMLWSYVISLPLNFQLCNVLGWFVTVSEVFPCIVWALFSSFRAAALSAGDLRVGAAVLAPSLAAIGISLVTDRTATIDALISRLLFILVDAMVIGITWKNTYGTWRVAAESGAQATLVTLLLRDGTLFPTVSCFERVVLTASFLQGRYTSCKLFFGNDPPFKTPDAMRQRSASAECGLSHCDLR